MTGLRHLLTAWQDQDQAGPIERVVIGVALLVLLVAAGLGEGPG